MSKNIDFKKEWEKTRAQLIKFSKEAAVLAKKGEQEIVSFSKKGKMQLDSTTAGIKKEKLLYFIGKEYYSLKSKSHPTEKIKKFVVEIEQLEKKQETLRSKIKSTTKAKKRKKASKS